MFKKITPTPPTQSSNSESLDSLSQELIYDIKGGDRGLLEIDKTRISFRVQDKIKELSKEQRKELVKIKRDGCAPLFIAARRGNIQILEYLINVCDADLEQTGLYELPEDRSIHCVTPLWCAAVSGHLDIVQCLARYGADINAISDTGSTPVRSACFMTHLEIVHFLCEHGADVKKPNYNGGTCLINAVQSYPLCEYILAKGADINARDIQDKTALHYAIQEHRFEITRFLIENGANPFIKSRYGDDALQTACLKGAVYIFDYLVYKVPYSVSRVADAHELIGSTLINERNEIRAGIVQWRLAARARNLNRLKKDLTVPKRAAYLNVTEFRTLGEIDEIASDIDLMRIHSLLISERVLGKHHKDTLFRLMFRGAACADAYNFQRCFDLWGLALEIRVQHYSILYSDTCHTAQALVRIMLDVNDQFFEYQRYGYVTEPIPSFRDIYNVYEILSDNVIESQELLKIKPIYRKQQDNFDRVLKCVTHLIYLLVIVAKTDEEIELLTKKTLQLIKANVRSACRNDTLLHLCVSSLNVIKSGYFMDDSNLKVVFPNAGVVKFLLRCGMDVNSKNESKSTPLHVALIIYNYDEEIVRLLLDNGAHIDQPNRADDRPVNAVSLNSKYSIPIMNYITLKCLAATVIAKYKIPFKNQVPIQLEDFIQTHLA